MSSQLHKELNILGILLHTFETTEVHPLMKVKIDVPLSFYAAETFRQFLHRMLLGEQKTVSYKH